MVRVQFTILHFTHKANDLIKHSIFFFVIYFLSEIYTLSFCQAVYSILSELPAFPLYSSFPYL